MKWIIIGMGFFFVTFSIGAGTFLETFDDRNLEEWQELVQLNNPPGTWEIIDDELHAVSHDPSIRLRITGDDTWEDYTIEFDVKPLEKHGVGGIFIAARVKETWVVYCSIADPVVLVDGKPLPGSRMSCAYGNLHDVIFVQLHAEPHQLLRLKKWAHLKLSVHDNMVTFWINEKQVMKPTELLNDKDRQHPELGRIRGFPDFLTGGVGFGLANYTARFDNMTIIGDSIPNKGGLVVKSAGKLATAWASLKRF